MYQNDRIDQNSCHIEGFASTAHASQIYVITKCDQLSVLEVRVWRAEGLSITP